MHHYSAEGIPGDVIDFTGVLVSP